MLILGMRSGDRVRVVIDGKEGWVTLLSSQTGRSKVGFEFAPEVEIDRQKVVEKKAAS